jgi:hypothetical protein
MALRLRNFFLTCILKFVIMDEAQSLLLLGHKEPLKGLSHEMDYLAFNNMYG